MTALRERAAALRESGAKAFLRAHCRLSRGYPQTSNSGYSAIVLSGPLRGRRFHMPTLERFSFGLGTYEPHVVKAIRAHLGRGAVAYDVGANAGYMTLVMASEGAHVFAFEPDERNLAALAKNVRDAKNVTVVKAAVADASGTARLATFEYSLVSQLERPNTATDAVFVDVACVSLDDFVYRDQHAPPDLLKIDVEGAEDRVFAGAARVLGEQRPVVIAEIRASAWDEIERLLRECRYGHRVLGGDADRLRTHGIADMLLTPVA